MERTFAILKPDCVEGKHCSDVLRTMVGAGFKVLAAKAGRLEEPKLREHYAHHAEKPFFPNLVAFMRRTPVIMLVLERGDAVAELRKLCGPTDSNEARKVAPGSIRAKFGKDKSENVIHASDSPETAKAEIGRFFDKQEIARAKKGGIPLSELETLVKALYG